jgi:predicted dehydrogenase
MAAGAALTILPAASARGYAANEKLNVALVGVSGRGSWFVETIPRIGENVVALCDVNQQRAAEAFKRFPDVPKFEDFR